MKIEKCSNFNVILTTSDYQAMMLMLFIEQLSSENIMDMLSECVTGLPKKYAIQDFSTRGDSIIIKCEEI